MKYIYSILIFFLLIIIYPPILYANKEKCQSSHQPQWVLNPLHDKQNYYGISSASFINHQIDYQTIEQAKNRAIKDLSYGLSVNIQSYYEEQLTSYKDDEIKSSFMLSARLVLNGIKVYEQWTDCKEKQHWVMVSINQSSADKQVKAQEFINQVLKCLKSGQKEILKSIDSMNEIISMRMKRIERQYEHLIKLSKVLDNKLTTSLTQKEKNYRDLIKHIKMLTHQFNQSQQQKNKQMSTMINVQQQLIKDVETISQHIQSDYFLSYINDDVAIPKSDLHVRIVPENGRKDFYEEENIRFWVKSNQDCFIKVLYISKTGKEFMIFPNSHDKNNCLKAGVQKTVGERNDLTVIQPFGLDTVTVIASKTQFSNINEQLKLNKGIYYIKRLRSPLHGVQTRAIGVVEKLSFQVYATDTCYIVSHKKR
ncbi:hypothetical protein MHK_001186 [Candidatus Magnetomorum sp. HK-1]|nr:hypothetical protein MHK_001186 [Candidatus Magnetomorum sp. HK-1]